MNKKAIKTAWRRAEDIPFREPGHRWQWLKDCLADAGYFCGGAILFGLASICAILQGIAAVACATCWIWVPYLIYVYFFKG